MNPRLEDVPHDGGGGAAVARRRRAQEGERAVWACDLWSMRVIAHAVGWRRTTQSVFLFCTLYSGYDRGP